MTTDTFEWVDEVPPRTSGGRKGGGKWAELYAQLSEHPGKIAKLGPMGPGSASGAASRMKELGAEATTRTVDGKGFVYVYVGATDELDPADHNSEGMFDD